MYLYIICYCDLHYLSSQHMKNYRREFLKITGLAGVASLIPFVKVFSGSQIAANSGGCVLIPSETAGPFPLDLTANNFYFRQDVTEGKPGVLMNLKLRIIGETNCLPMENLRVNIWHCDKDGTYSGYGAQTGLTDFRGYQLTDANGEVNFITILPGWYPGRVCHIHFQVYVNSSYAAISQLTFDENTKQLIYSANPSIYINGIDPTSIISDGVFSNGYTYQLASLTPNVTGGYDSYLEVTIQGSGVSTGMGNIEKETAKQFSLGQNFPNPFENKTTIPFKLVHPSDVTFDLYDLQGRKVKSIEMKGLASGEHLVDLDLAELELTKSGYAYQFEIRNTNGIFRDCKFMTSGK